MMFLFDIFVTLLLFESIVSQESMTQDTEASTLNPLTREQPDSPLHRHPIISNVLNILQNYWKLGWKGYQDYPNSAHTITGDPNFFNHEVATVPSIVDPGLPKTRENPEGKITDNPFFSSDERVQSFMIQRSYGPWMQIIDEDTEWTSGDTE